MRLFKPFNDPCSNHVETSQLICSANQLTGFYMIGTLVVKGLKLVLMFCSTQLTFTCSKSAMKTIEKGLKYMQSQQ